MTDKSGPGARERILRAAYELFSQRGVRAVSVDEIIGQANVAIATFYRHFRSKDDLALAFLNRRERLWATDAIVSTAREQSSNSAESLLAIFDIFDEWFQQPDFEGDSFINVLIEMGPDHPLGQASIEHLAAVRRSVEQLALEAGLVEPEEFAHSFQILMKGAIITASAGDAKAAGRGRAMAERLVRDHREQS